MYINDLSIDHAGRIHVALNVSRVYAHITNINDVKYWGIFMNIKTGYEYYNLLFVLFSILEQQSPSIYIQNQLSLGVLFIVVL